MRNSTPKVVPYPEVGVVVVPRKKPTKPRKMGRPRVKIPAALKRRYLRGESPRALAREFQISENTIYRCAKAENWRHETPPQDTRAKTCPTCKIACTVESRRVELWVDGARRRGMVWASRCPTCFEIYIPDGEVERLTTEIRGRGKD